MKEYNGSDANGRLNVFIGWPGATSTRDVNVRVIGCGDVTPQAAAAARGQRAAFRALAAGSAGRVSVLRPVCGSEEALCQVRPTGGGTCPAVSLAAYVTAWVHVRYCTASYAVRIIVFFLLIHSFSEVVRIGIPSASGTSRLFCSRGGGDEAEKM